MIKNNFIQSLEDNKNLSEKDKQFLVKNYNELFRTPLFNSITILAREMYLKKLKPDYQSCIDEAIEIIKIEGNILEDENFINLLNEQTNRVFSVFEKNYGTDWISFFINNKQQKDIFFNKETADFSKFN
jgi:hypothetical protein